MPAQGNALGTLGEGEQALKGRDTLFAPSGLGLSPHITQGVAPGWHVGGPLALFGVRQTKVHDWLLTHQLSSNPMNNKFEIVVYWSEQDGHYLAEVPELPSIITDGANRVEALRNAEEMIDAYLAAARVASWTIPEPKGRLAFA